MAIISKVHRPFIGHQEYRKIVSVDSAGTFKCNLPDPVRKMFATDTVTGASLEAVERQFADLLQRFASATTTTRRVIMWAVDDGENHSFAKGLILGICVGVFEETVVKSGEDERVDYDLVHFSPLGDLATRAHELRFGHRRGRPQNVMEFTEERLAFFVKLGNSLVAVRNAIAQLEQPDRMLEIVDGRAPLTLTPPQ